MTVAATAVLLFGGWSLYSAAGPAVAAGGPLTVPGGQLVVGKVHAATAPMGAMPGMGTDPDPVPDGERRVTVDVTLIAGDTPMSYAAGQFTLDTGAGALRPHRAVLPGSGLAAGTRLSGALIYDIPAGATTGVLTGDGDHAVRVGLPRPAESHSTH